MTAAKLNVRPGPKIDDDPEAPEPQAFRASTPSPNGPGRAGGRPSEPRYHEFPLLMEHYLAGIQPRVSAVPNTLARRLVPEQEQLPGLTFNPFFRGFY